MAKNLTISDYAKREIARRNAERELCKRSLAHFLRLAWPTLEPYTELVWGWHLDAMCEHLTAVTNRKIKNLLINVPPGTTKSKLCSVVWPVWFWLHDPGIRFLSTANRTQLSTDFAVESRRLIESEWFQSRFGECFKLVGDQNTKSKYVNDKTGRRQAVGVDGKATGDKADVLLCLPAGTKVSTKVGDKPIEEVTTSDEVACYDHDSNSIEFSRPTFSGQTGVADSLIEIETDSGEVVRCTPDHRVFHPIKGYVPACDVGFNPVVCVRMDSRVMVDRVVSIRMIEASCPVYDLTIPSHGNFFADGILVHNCDDADDAKKVHSSVSRRAVHDYWDKSFYNRVNNHITGRRVVIAQRLIEGDLSGHILKTGGFEHLMIPEEFSPSRRIFTSIGWTDPRTEEGELLRENRFGQEEIKQAKRRLGAAGYAAQHLQDPKGGDDGHFRELWLGNRWRWDGPTIVLGEYRFSLEGRAIWMTVDPATDTEKSDNTAIAVWTSSPRGDLIWLDVVRDRIDLVEQPKKIKEIWEKWGAVAVGVESVAYQMSLVKHCQAAGVPTVPLSTRNKGKLLRAMPAMTLAESGKLWLPETSETSEFPVEDIVSELLSFTGEDGGKDDCVDCLSYAVEMLPRYSMAATSGKMIQFFDRPKETTNDFVTSGKIDLPSTGLFGINR